MGAEPERKLLGAFQQLFPAAETVLEKCSRATRGFQLQKHFHMGIVNNWLFPSPHTVTPPPPPHPSCSSPSPLRGIIKHVGSALLLQSAEKEVLVVLLGQSEGLSQVLYRALWFPKAL